MKALKIVLVFLASLILGALSGRLFSQFYIDLFNVQQGGTFFVLHGVAEYIFGFVLSYVFFTALLFEAIIGKKGRIWGAILILPALYFEIRFDLSHIYLSVILIIFGWLLGLIVKNLIRKTQLTRPLIRLHQAIFLHYYFTLFLFVIVLSLILSYPMGLGVFKLYDISTGFSSFIVNDFWTKFIQGLNPAYIFSLIFLFTIFGRGRKAIWILLLLIPALFVELFLGGNYILFSAGSGIAAWVIGLLIAKAFGGMITDKNTL